MNVEQIQPRFDYWLQNNSILRAATIVGRQAGLSEVDTLKLAAVELANHMVRLMATIQETYDLAQPRSAMIIRVPDEVASLEASIVSSDHARAEDSHEAARKSIAAGEFVSDDEFLAMHRHQ